MTGPAPVAVIGALTATGRPARFVGGAVRDAILGLPPGDLDVATAITPTEAATLLTALGARVVPTGLAHGTVTAILDGVPIEITTLRRDIETDGRHALVRFTDDWTADARRRDFTINALYADLDGTVYDPTGGLADLAAGRVRFVGDPATRIAEDYLRILRFFRFWARFARVAPEPGTESALRDGLAGLDRLAGERVDRELQLWLGLAAPCESVALADRIGLWQRLFGAAADLPALVRLLDAESASGIAADPVRRLAAVTGRADAQVMIARLRSSRAVAQRLLRIAEARRGIAETDPGSALALVRRLGARAVQDASLIDQAGGAWMAAASRAAPAIPVRAADLLERGVQPGPALGQHLAALQAWCDARDEFDRVVVLAELDRRLAD